MSKWVNSREESLCRFTLESSPSQSSPGREGSHPKEQNVFKSCKYFYSHCALLDTQSPDMQTLVCVSLSSVIPAYLKGLLGAQIRAWKDYHNSSPGVITYCNSPRQASLNFPWQFITSWQQNSSLSTCRHFVLIIQSGLEISMIEMQVF